MPLPELGQRLPDATLSTFDGAVPQRLSALVADTPALLVLFKQSCATSRLALPFIERLHRNYPALAVLGVSQDSAEETAPFVAQADLSFPVALDEGWRYSAELDLFTVPTVFLLERGGAIRRVNMGWSKEQYDALSGDIAAVLGAAPVPLFRDGDHVPPFKPG